MSQVRIVDSQTYFQANAALKKHAARRPLFPARGFRVSAEAFDREIKLIRAGASVCAGLRRCLVDGEKVKVVVAEIGEPFYAFEQRCIRLRRACK